MGRMQSSETRQKQREASKAWFDKLRSDPIAWDHYRKKQSEGTLKRYANREEIRRNRLLTTNFDDLGSDSKRERIILEQSGRCAKCKLNEWLGIQLTLEIDHINGNHQDNTRENLIGLCPNCHSITPTWRGKNKKSCTRVSDQIALDAIKTEPTIRQALLKCGLSPRGGNYKRFSRLKESLVL